MKMEEGGNDMIYLKVINMIVHLCTESNGWLLFWFGQTVCQLGSAI